ncbi:MAG: hypothetical protein ACREIA_21780, partial [Opitutaceae bacterium]
MNLLHNTRCRWWCNVSSFCAVLVLHAGAATQAVEINRVEPIKAWPLLEPPTYDSEMSVERLADGTLWAAWQAYYGGKEAILARHVRDARQGRFIQVSPREGIHGHPDVVSMGANGAWVVWMSCDGGRWKVLARRITNEAAGDVVVVSPGGVDAVNPAAARSGPAGMWVAWQALVGGRMTVQARRFEREQWTEPITVSNGEAEAFRPMVVAGKDGDEAWILWDEYRELNYSVKARRLAQKLGKIEAVSPEGTYAVKPDAIVTTSGELWATWVETRDVIGGDAAIDQSNSAVVAVRRDGRWQTVPDADGRHEIVSLDQGLLARMAPKYVPTGGYLGERRKPMLLENDGSVWIVCERKSDESMRTPDAAGELVGREYRDGRWSEPRTLHRGLLDYHPGNRRSENGAWTFAASRLPRETRRIHERVDIIPAAANAAKDDRVAGWSAVELPVRPRAAAPEKIQENGRTLQLYWMDSHVHS